MQNLWHAIDPKFLAEGVASVSQHRRRGAGSTPVSTAPLPPPPALGSPVAPFVHASLAALPRGARALLERGLHHLLVWCPPAPDGDWAVVRWRIASRDWPPFKATRTSTVPNHLTQNLWHAIEPKFLADGAASVSQDRRRGAGSTPVSTAPLPLPPALSSPVAPFVRASFVALPRGARALRVRGLHHFLVWRPPGPVGDWAVSRWRISARGWPPLRCVCSN